MGSTNAGRRIGREPNKGFGVGRLRPARLVVGAALLVACGLVMAACSLGEGITQTCDSEAPANSEGACTETSVCDAGNGIVKAEEGCCVAVGTYLYGICLGAVYEGNFRDECTAAATDNACCANSDSAYKVCMEGRYPVSAKPSSSAAGGGASASSASAGGGG